MVEAATGGVAGGTAGGGPASADGGVDNNGLVVAEGSSSGGGARRRPLGTLADVMREPSTTVPDVVVLDTMPDGLERREALDPREDLWLSTSDGRYSSTMIPLRVGTPPYLETFYVHKHILTKAEYFKKALCGDFRESETQSIDLPEENPSIFHFLIAYLYEGRYDPIKPVASALTPDLDKGKGKEPAPSSDVSSDSEVSVGSLDSDISAVSRRRRARRRRREERHWERVRQKHPGLHRPNCGCPTCLSASGPPCWACSAPRVPPPQPIHPPVIVLDRDGHARNPAIHHHHAHHRDRRGAAGRLPRRRYYGPDAPAVHNPYHRPRTPPTPPPPPGAGAGWDPHDPNGGGRIRGEDLRTWLLAYELNLDVYVLANKFLLGGFKREVARAAVDMLETAGSDAAVPEVLALCRKLYAGLAEADPLLRMVLARVGFLQPLLWRRAPDETGGFLVANPEVAALILRETVSRREEDINGRVLPSMERPWFQSPSADSARFPYQQWMRGQQRF